MDHFKDRDEVRHIRAVSHTRCLCRDSTTLESQSLIALVEEVGSGPCFGWKKVKIAN